MFFGTNNNPVRIVSPFTILPFHLPRQKLASNLANSISSWPLHEVHGTSTNHSTATLVVERGSRSLNIKYCAVWPQQHDFGDQRVFIFCTEVKNGTPQNPQCTVIISTMFTSAWLGLLVCRKAYGGACKNSPVNWPLGCMHFLLLWHPVPSD